MSRKWKDLPIKHDKDLLFHFDELEKCSQREASTLKPSQPTLKKILKNEIVEYYGEQNLPLFQKRKRNGRKLEDTK